MSNSKSDDSAFFFWENQSETIGTKPADFPRKGQHRLFENFVKSLKGAAN